MGLGGHCTQTRTLLCPAGITGMCKILLAPTAVARACGRLVVLFPILVLASQPRELQCRFLFLLFVFLTTHHLQTSRVEPDPVCTICSRLFMSSACAFARLAAWGVCTRWPAMQTLLQNEGVFRQLCQEPASGAPVWCNAAAERYSAIYSAGGERRASHSHTSRAPPPPPPCHFLLVVRPGVARVRDCALTGPVCA